MERCTALHDLSDTRLGDLQLLYLLLKYRKAKLSVGLHKYPANTEPQRARYHYKYINSFVSFYVEFKSKLLQKPHILKLPLQQNLDINGTCHLYR